MFRFYYIIIMNLFRLPYIIHRLNKMAKHPEIYSVEERYKMARYIVWLVKTTGMIRTKVFGTENLPTEGGYIMYPNHQGKYDALGIVHGHKEPCSIVMDEARSHTIVTTQIVDIVDGKRLKKDDVRQAMTVILEMAEEAAAGKKFIIFPEGGYNHNHNNVQEFKPGSFKSSMKSKTPIVPVAIIDSYKAFEGFHPGIINTQVHFLPAIPYEEYKDMKTVEIAEMVRGRIVEKIDEVLSTRK